MFATKTRTVSGFTSDKQKYNATITETYQNGAYYVDTYGSIGGVVFGESWVNGTMQKGNESYSVEIVNGVLKRENMANSTVQPVKKEKISKKNEIKKVSEQEKSMPIVIYVKELKENQK